MNIKNHSYSIKNIKLTYQYTPTKNKKFNPLTPSSTGKISTNYSNNNIYRGHIYKNIFRYHNKTESYNKNNFQTNYINTMPIENKLRNKFIFRILNQEKKIRNKFLISSMNFPNKKYIKKENLFFIPKKYQFKNLHRILMEKNKASIIAEQEKELNKIKSFESNKDKKICLTQENNSLFEKELYKTPIDLIKKKTNFMKIINSENITRNKDKDDIGLSKTVKERDPIYEINHVSQLPKIINDKNLIFKLWKKDMKKYCDLTIGKNKKNKKLVHDLLCVYN